MWGRIDPCRASRTLPTCQKRWWKRLRSWATGRARRSCTCSVGTTGSPFLRSPRDSTFLELALTRTFKLSNGQVSFPLMCRSNNAGAVFCTGTLTLPQLPSSLLSGPNTPPARKANTRTLTCGCDSVPRLKSDTPSLIAAVNAYKRHDGHMSAIAGRQRRQENAPTVLLQARVAPEIREEVQAAAAASGVSIAYYLENMLRAQISENGALPLVALPRPKNVELPIPAA
jgi:hypothetical protein